MPKYNYECETCNREWGQWGPMNDVVVECPHCFSKRVKKLPSLFFVIKDEQDKKDKSAKQNVVEHIEENREVLKQMKEETKKQKVIKDV